MCCIRLPFQPVDPCHNCLDYLVHLAKVIYQQPGKNLNTKFMFTKIYRFKDFFDANISKMTASLQEVSTKVQGFVPKKSPRKEE